MVHAYVSEHAKDEAVWILNCGQGACRHHGWQPLLRQLRLLKKWTQGPKLLLAGVEEEEAEGASSPAVQQRAGSRPAVIKTAAYTWAGSSPEGKQNLSRFIQACDCLWPIVTRPFDSCQGYVERVQHALSVLAAPALMRTPVLQAQYSGPWVLRALLLSQLRCREVKALDGAASVTTKSFCEAVPDQCGWVEQLCRHSDRARVKSRSSFQDFLDYTGLSSEPPEYCCTHLCIWGNQRLPAEAVQLFSKDPVKARVQVLQFRIEHGMWPLPETIWEMMAAMQPPAVQLSRTRGSRTVSEGAVL